MVSLTDDETWRAIYAAEFVRRMADSNRFAPMDEDMIQRESDESRALADWHREVLTEAREVTPGAGT